MGDASAPVAAGQLLAGKYRIERVLGAGGMGVVVAATHEELDQRVAIKFLLPAALENADVVARFKREARAAVKIQSEHVARVIDVGTLDNGSPFMVMEYLEGGDLAQKIAEARQLAVGELVSYVLEACEALAEAHAAGIVHRDLKPANLFLARRADKTAMVKVLDFGISKSTLTGSGGITSTQAVMGSPYYMSPEQLMSAKHVDHRADIWSLGIVMYEALVGTPPYVGDTMPEIVAKILQAPTPSVRAARADVTSELDGVIARCLAKSASDRFADVAELANALVAFTSNGQRSVDRISRVLGAPSTRPAVRGDVTAALPLQNRTTPNPPLPATTSPAWTGADLAGVPKHSNTALVAAAIVLGVGVTVAIGFALTRHPAESSRSTSVGIVTSIASSEATVNAIAATAPTLTETPITTATTTSVAAAATPVAHLGRGNAKPTTSVVAPTATATTPVVVATAPPTATSAPPPPPTTTATQTSGTLHMIIK